MSAYQGMLNELDNELKSTRKHLERIPEDKLDWKPHEKSMAMGRLGSHIAEMLQWLVVTVEHDAFDMAPPGEEPHQSADFGTVAELLDYFDAQAKVAKAALQNADESKMMEPWALKNGGETIFSLPRIACLRGFCLNHIYHHRAQLGVYLRLNDVPVPAVYGPSADDQAM